MTPNERVHRTLKFQTPDHTPRDLWLLPSAFLQHGQKLVELLKRHPCDINRGKAKMPTLPPRYRKGTYTDEWGCLWRNLQDGIIGEVVEPAIRSWSDLASFRPPPVTVETEAAAEKFRDFPDGFHVCGASNLFERLQFLRKSEQLYVDLMEQRKELFQLRQIVVDYVHQCIDRCLATRCDGICFSDDWGSQRGLLIRPELWRQFFKPCYREFFEHARDGGRFVFFHSDGHIMDIIEDLIEIGVDALNSQVWCMGVEELGARFRGRITFWGELNRQWTVPHGTPADIRTAARRMKEHLATAQGGLIGQAEVDRLTPLENIEAILTAWDASS